MACLRQAALPLMRRDHVQQSVFPAIAHSGRAMNSQHARQQTVIDGLQDANLKLAQVIAENDLLQADRLHLASIVESSDDAIVSMDMRGLVTSWNRAATRMFGFTATQIVGRSLAILFPPDRRHEEAEIMGRIKTGEIAARYETVRLRQDGTALQVSLTVSPIRDSAGTTVGVSKIIQDITGQVQARQDMKALQAELVHLSRWNMMGMMASSLAHELNQPLTATLNYVHAARRTLKDAAAIPRACQFLDLAVAETKLAGGIIRSLRAFIEKRETNRLPENLNDVLEEGLTLSLYLGANARKKVRIKFAADLPPVRVDRIHIQQVLLNLVRNGFEAMADTDGEMLVIETANGDPGFVTVSVSDNGAGLSPEIQNQLFRPFVTTKEKGMGVGLSICQTLVEAHGGRIWTEPNLPHGAIFRFRLPLTTKVDDAS
jgi:two-component system sensor kinase FixL